jgi:hypothetical protein
MREGKAKGLVLQTLHVSMLMMDLNCALLVLVFHDP